MFPESDLLPLSGLQHLIFCERQWGLIHLEQIWVENRLTAEGRILHERSDTSETEVRGDLRIARALRIHSLRLGLAGVADVVEFHRVAPAGKATEGDPLELLPPAEPGGVLLRGARGVWVPMPVEFKRGKPKADRCDEIQLCAQALCLEEMLSVAIPAGALYYGKTRRRTNVAFDAELRTLTESAAARMRQLYDQRRTPAPVYSKKCEKCSLIEVCQPRALMDKAKIDAYMALFQ